VWAGIGDGLISRSFSFVWFVGFVRVVRGSFFWSGGLSWGAWLNFAVFLWVYAANAQGIEAEIPQAPREGGWFSRRLIGGAEELERIARSPRSGDAPKFRIKTVKCGSLGELD
jgi:hypothetical protein